MWYYAEWWPVRLVVALVLVFLIFSTVCQWEGIQKRLRKETAEGEDPPTELGTSTQDTAVTCGGIVLLGYLYCICSWGLIWSAVTLVVFVVILQACVCAPAMYREYASKKKDGAAAGAADSSTS